MRVLFATFSASTLLGGGVRVQVDSLARELRKLGIEVELFDPWKPYEVKDFDLFHLFAAHVGTYHLGRAVRTLGARLVVSPVFFSRHSAGRVKAMLNLAGRLRKLGGVWTEHMFCKELCDMAELVLPNTQAEADLVCRAFSIPKDKIRLLPNGCDDRFRKATPDLFVSRYGIRDFILYVGHIGWGRKNVLRLLQAGRRIERPLVLIGDLLPNDYGRECKSIIDATPGMTHISSLPPDSGLLDSAYAACDTLVLPGIYETPGLAALEAGLAGAKICITRFGGTSEYFGTHATYLDPRSELSILEALRESIAMPKSPDLARLIESRFLWGEAARNLAASYRLLFQGSHC